jgi:SAM-dependent methyltransferase
MFELANLNEFIALKARNTTRLYPEEHQWGLKQFGTLFCLDYLSSKEGRFLEVGAGQNRFFDEHLPPAIDYWAIDKSGFYDREKYRHSASLRRRTTLVDGLLGDFSPALPDNSFDAVFSISALEHVKVEQVPDVCRDMCRILKPGGIAVLTLDLPPSLYETIGSAYEDASPAAGFRYLAEPAVDYSRVATDGLLCEPAAIVFKFYYGRREDPWQDPPKLNEHTCAIKVVAEKHAG